MFRRTDLVPKGDEAEAVAESFLASVALVTAVTNVTRDADWQKRKVDYLLTFADGSMGKVEVKSDRHIASKRNALFELMRIHHTAAPEHCAYPGWSVVSEADRFLIWCPPAAQLFFMNAADLRIGMQQYTREARRSMMVNIQESDATRTTINILVPLSYVPHRVYGRVNGEWTCVSQSSQSGKDAS